MSNDLLEKPDQVTDPIQQQYGDNAIFSQLTNAERMAKDGVSRGSGAGADSAPGGGGFFNRDGDKAAGGGAASSAAAVSAAGLGAAEALGNGFTPGGQVGAALKLGKMFLGSRRRKQATASGSIFGVIIGGTFLAFTIASGPLELIHLTEILAKNFTHTQHSTEIRSRGLFRFARTKDIGQTRVGILGARSYAKTVRLLEERGITFNKGSISGAINDITIDPNKLAKSLPELQNKTPEAQLEIIKQRIPSIAGDVQLSSGKIIANTNAEISIVRGFGKESISLLSDSKIMQAMKFRPFAKVVNTPSIWHPLKKVKAAYENKLAGVLEARKVEEDRIKSEQTNVETKATIAEAELGSKFSPFKAALGGVALITAAACLVRESADTIVTYNHDAIVLKGTAETVSQMSLGSQVANSGTDVTNQNVSANQQSLTAEDGTTVWQSKALQETAQAGSGTGTDIPPEIAQAYIPSNTAAGLKSTLGLGTVGALACTKPGQLIQLGVGLFLIAASIPSGGLSTAALVGLKVGEVVGQAAVTAGVMYAIKNIIVEIGKNHSTIPTILAGETGGSILALNAREASNIDARADGGVALSDSQTAAIDQQTQVRSETEFSAKSVFARVFDMKDYRSLASRVIDSPAANSNNVASLISDAPSLVMSAIFPKAHAAQTPYKWPMPRYDIPADVLADSKFIDPYDNANAVASMLDAEVADPSSGTDYINRAKVCFGDTINKGPEGWQVIYDSDVNPNSESYSNSNCGDAGDDWHRLMLFVKDSRTMDAATCLDYNDTVSCAMNGFGASPASDSANTTTGRVNDHKKTSLTAHFTTAIQTLPVCKLVTCNAVTFIDALPPLTRSYHGLS